ncbi:MAG: hypothetical protein ACI8ZB_003016 [Desulforhopalus sp.]|jgi:hypothetical protein
MATIERRKEIRINKHNTFQFTTAQGDQVASQGLLVDYSAAGIRFLTDEPVDKNISLLIQLNLNEFDNDDINWRDLWETGEEPYLNVIGSVMWCLATNQESGKFEVGTRFTQKVMGS